MNKCSKTVTIKNPPTSLVNTVFGREKKRGGNKREIVGGNYGESIFTFLCVAMQKGEESWREWYDKKDLN